MDRLIDLDLAAAEILSRLPAWTASGLVPGPLTWRDGTARWPRPLETERTLVTDPDSVGVQIEDGDERNIVRIVLFRGGWADVDALAGGEGITENPDVSSVAEFGALLDSAITRFMNVRRPPAI
ncbi:hypothetical protein F5X71_17910 [Nocardia brasiliensis]|uniref:Uncharacterized protein n=2 Tax=Nocardia brasiliensis TaxID=37326 RepID=A0A6G9Y2S8_NOCBR|nr:hypothetical protein F5X71_17910 [Nocardia brasiliensis]